MKGAIKMSWDRIDYIAEVKCPCGRGIIQRKYYERWNDWNQHDGGIEEEKILCIDCSQKYHIEHIIKHFSCPKWDGDGVSDTTYCVPNDIRLNAFDMGKKNANMFYSFEEEIVSNFSKDELKYALDEMYVKKYSTRLNDDVSKKVMRCFELHFNTKRFRFYYETLKRIIEKYDEYIKSYQCTKKQIDAFEQEEQGRLAKEKEKFSEAISKSIVLDFPRGEII